MVVDTPLHSVRVLTVMCITRYRVISNHVRHVSRLSLPRDVLTTQRGSFFEDIFVFNMVKELRSYLRL